MSNPKPFRFSLQSFNTDSPANWRNLIAKNEDLGHSTFFILLLTSIFGKFSSLAAGE